MAVDWNETSKVASLVWRGSSSTIDWVQDFKLWCVQDGLCRPNLMIVWCPVSVLCWFPSTRQVSQLCAL